MAAGAGSAGPALTWVATVVDKTKDFFIAFDKAARNSASMAKAAFQGIDFGASIAGGALTVGLGAATVAAGFLLEKLLQLGDVSIDVFVGAVEEATKLAARADTLGAALTVVARNAGYTAEEIERFEEGITDVNITTITARQSLLKMIQAELDLTKAVELANVAKDAAVIANLNSSESLDRIIHASVTLNPLILKRMNLLINTKEAYRDAGLSITELTSGENTLAKQQAFLNAVIKAGSNIVGAYAAAQGTAGARAKSLARQVEQLQIEFGKAFQPAYLVFINALGDAILEATNWFKENEAAVEDFANTLGNAAQRAVIAMELLANTLSLVGGAIGEVLSAAGRFGGAFVESLGTIGKFLARWQAIKLGVEISAEEIETRWQHMGVTIGQTISVLVTAFVVGFKIVADVISGVADSAVAVWAIATKKIAEALGLPTTTLEAMIADAEKRISERLFVGAGGMEAYKDSLRELANETMISMGQLTGVLEVTADEVDAAANSIVGSWQKIANETADVVSRIQDLNKKFADAFEDLAIRATRAAIDAEIRELRRREDLHRRHIERLEAIHRRFAERREDIRRDQARDAEDEEEDENFDRIDAAKDHARDLLDIEIEYRRTLQKIQRDFEEDVQEAARRNDAVAVARLFRKRKKDLKEAAIGRDEDIEDAKTDYKRALEDLEEHLKRKKARLKKDAKDRMEDLERDLERALKAAEEQRKKDLENLERSLARAKEDKIRHREWDEGDLRRRFRDELEALGQHFAGLEHITDLGLKILLSRHGEFIEDDLTLWDSYYKRLRGMSEDQFSRSGIGGIWRNPWEDPYERPGDDGEDNLGFARGGVGLATGRQRITIGETEPEAFAAIPLSAISTINHNINMQGSIDVSGVSPGMEQDISGAVMGLLAQFGQQLLASQGAPR